MPLSSDPVKRANQLANLRPSTPAPRGNDRALTHGIYAGRTETLEVGVWVFHSRYCAAHPSSACRCSVKARAYDARRGKAITRSFPTADEARAWRREALLRWARKSEGKLDRAYVAVRDLASELDSIDASPSARARADVRAALGAVYVAEDAIVKALRSARVADPANGAA